MDLFGFSMLDSYEDRKVACYKQDDVFISTAAITDSDQPYETAIGHPKYNDAKLIIVEMYDTKGEAQAGHKRWVTTMTGEQLPSVLKDVSSSGIASFANAFGCDSIFERGI